MAWCCGCVPIAQAVGRLAAFSDNSAAAADARESKYKFVMLISAILFLANMLLGINVLWLFLFTMLFQARQNARRAYGMQRSNFCSEIMTSCCCGPCAILQLAYQIWARPDDNPGVDFSSMPCHASNSFHGMSGAGTSDTELGGGGPGGGSSSTSTVNRDDYYRHQHFVEAYAQSSQPMYSQPPTVVAAERVVESEDIKIDYDSQAYVNAYMGSGSGR